MRSENSSTSNEAPRKEETWAWWEARRARYNIGLVKAGIFAWIVCHLIGETLLPEEAEYEVTIFTIVLSVIAYLIMMAIANVCYCLGPLLERLIEPAHLDQYRALSYGAGFWFSALLPFLAPVMMLVFN